MSHARLLALEVTNFKSYREKQRVDVAPLTVLLGRNNSGKSSLIQPLLLLKQTLAVPRPEVALHLGGPYVTSRQLGDLTHGWLDWCGPNRGIGFVVEWHSRVDMNQARSRWVESSTDVVAKRSGLPWLASEENDVDLDVRMELNFTAHGHHSGLNNVRFTLLPPASLQGVAVATFEGHPGRRHAMTWNDAPAADGIHVTMDHFLPYVDVASVEMGRNDTRRAYLNAWLSTFAPAIEDLRKLLGEFQYLSSARAIPREQNDPVGTPPMEVGAAGEQAAAMYKARADESVHFLLPTLPDAPPDETVHERRLKDAVHEVLGGLGVEGTFSIDDGDLFGYRLLFGRAAMPHVGRGLTYLLPVIEVGLLADPLRFQGSFGDVPLAEYQAKAGRSMLVALEEAESHLHPKVQTRLAHWLVALARCNRQVIVETHSDHLVRRLRGLAARAGTHSPMETWLLGNVRIYGVEQKDGVSTVTAMSLTPEGGIGDPWPSDFMDEASEEDSAIFYGALAKREAAERTVSAIVHDEGEEDDPKDTGSP